MTTTTQEKYSSLTILLHWLGALLVIGLLIVGSIMEDMTGEAKFQLLTLHYYGGLATGVVFLLRLVFFFLHARPVEDPAWPKWQAQSAKAVHALLYLLPIIMVASGLVAWFVFDLQSYVANGDVEGYRTAHRILPMLVHGLSANLLIAAVVLHIVAALYHQFMQKDNILNRMSMRG